VSDPALGSKLGDACLIELAANMYGKPYGFVLYRRSQHGFEIFHLNTDILAQAISLACYIAKSNSAVWDETTNWLEAVAFNAAKDRRSRVIPPVNPKE
jgi:hypothetical protein